MSECLDDMAQCKLCEEWFHISCEGFKTAPEGASNSALSADLQTLDVFVIVKVLFRSKSVRNFSFYKGEVPQRIPIDN